MGAMNETLKVLRSVGSTVVDLDGWMYVSGYTTASHGYPRFNEYPRAGDEYAIPNQHADKVEVGLRRKF